MIRYENEPLMYRPEREPFNAHLDRPAEVMRQHMLDQQAKEQADRVMAQRDMELQMRAGSEASAQGQRAREFDASERHGQRRDDLYDRQEERRNREVVLDRNKLTDQEHEKLIHQLFYGATEPEQRYAAAELARHGFMPPEPLYDEPPGAMPSAAPAPQGAPPASAKPMGKGDAALSSQLDNIDATYSKGLGAKPGLGMPYKQAKAQADATGALGVKQVGRDLWLPISQEESDAANAENDAATPRFLPGQNPMRARAVKSDQMLSADDPLNQIVK